MPGAVPTMLPFSRSRAATADRQYSFLRATHHRQHVYSNIATPSLLATYTCSMTKRPWAFSGS